MGTCFSSGPTLSSELHVSAHSQSGDNRNVVSAHCQKQMQSGRWLSGHEPCYAVMRPWNPSNGVRGWRQADPVRAHRPNSQKASFLFSKRPCHKAVNGRSMKKTPECGPLHVLAGAHVCTHLHTCTIYAKIPPPTHTPAKWKQRGMFISLSNIRM